MSMDKVDKSNKGAREYNQCEGTTRFGRCVVDVNDRQASYSKLFYKKNLCFSCQREENEKHGK